MGENFGIDSHEVEKKMRCLIGQFQRELRWFSATGAIPLHSSKWKYFHSLLFLKDKHETWLSDAAEHSFRPLGLCSGQSSAIIGFRQGKKLDIVNAPSTDLQHIGFC